MKVTNELLLEKRCQEFCKINEEIKFLEERKRELRDQIKADLKAEGITEKLLPSVKILLSEFPKEYFSLKDAKEALPDKILSALRPFCKIQNEERVLVTLRPQASK